MRLQVELLTSKNSYPSQPMYKCKVFLNAIQVAGSI